MASPHSALRPAKLFLGGLTRGTTTKQLRDHFSQYGRVLDCVAMRQPDGRARGFGYVTLDSPAAAERCLVEAQVIDGRVIDTKRAVPGNADAGSPSSSGDHAAPTPRSARGFGNSPKSPFFPPGAWDCGAAHMGYPGSPYASPLWAAWAGTPVANPFFPYAAASLSPASQALEVLDCLGVLQGSSAGQHGLDSTSPAVTPTARSSWRGFGAHASEVDAFTPAARLATLQEADETPQKVDLPLTLLRRSSASGMITSDTSASLLKDPVKAPLPSPMGAKKGLPAPAKIDQATMQVGKKGKCLLPPGAVTPRAPDALAPCDAACDDNKENIDPRSAPLTPPPGLSPPRGRQQCKTSAFPTGPVVSTRPSAAGDVVECMFLTAEPRTLQVSAR